MNFTTNITIADWLYWGEHYYDKNMPNGIAEPQYNLSDIPAIKRRRLPEVAKRIHRFSQRLADEQIPIIYASYNAEFSQTLAIIRSFNDDVSPAKFSLSVHNAIAGLLSVTHNNTQSYQAMDSLSGLIETAIVEAKGLLLTHEKIGIVYYDETLPTEFASVGDNVPDTHVLAMTLCREQDNGQAYYLEKIPTPKQHAVDNMVAEFANVVQVADFLRGDANTLVNTYANTTWKWSRNVC